MMSVCWYCYWGWPKAIRDIYEQASEKLGGYTSVLNFGPAHVVWEDENFDAAQSCLDNFDKHSNNLSSYEKAVVRWSLEQLLLLPDKIINSEPSDYDGENPENYPPPSDIEWEKS